MVVQSDKASGFGLFSSLCVFSDREFVDKVLFDRNLLVTTRL